MGQSIVLREARSEDAPALTPLSAQLGYPSAPDQIAARLAILLADPENAVFVAEVDNRIIGWIQVGNFVTVETDPAAEIRGLVVEDGRRGSGVGRLLVARAEQWARDHGLTTITVRSNIIRDGAHAFYRRLDYQIVKTQHAFRKKLA